MAKAAGREKPSAPGAKNEFADIDRWTSGPAT
jgi:hypothetical protein